MAAMAASAAVSVRNTRGPRLMPLKPNWLIANASSAALKPPSGPTNRVAAGGVGMTLGNLIVPRLAGKQPMLGVAG